MARTLPHVPGWTPALVLAAVVVADTNMAHGHSVAGLVMIAPLLASSLVHPKVTAAYGVVAFAVWASLAEVDGQFADGAARVASIIRGCGIVIGVVIAVAAATARERREERLRRVELVANVAQRAILIPVPAELGPLQLAARYESSAQDAAVGGDFYDAAETRYGTRILLGDVRGKGLEAVRLAAHTLGAFRERADETADLSELLDRLSAAVSRRAAPGDFVTALILQIDDAGCLTVVTAGHLPPVLVREHMAGLLDVPVIRPPLGFIGRGAPVRHQLRPGDELLLYTDGVTEARRYGDREFFDEQRLLLAATHPGGPQDRVDHIVEALTAWTGHNLTDDVALLALTYHPDEDPTATTHHDDVSAFPAEPTPGQSFASADTLLLPAPALVLSAATTLSNEQSSSTTATNDTRIDHVCERTAVPSHATAPDSPVSVVLDLPFDLEAPSLARRFVTEHTQGLPASTRADAALLASELVTNAARYGQPNLALRLTVNARTVTVRVTDHGAGIPALPSSAPDPTAPSGRGLIILDAIADSWGVRPHAAGSGKTVWFELIRPSDR